MRALTCSGRDNMEINDKVADFALQDDSEKTVHLKDFAGKPVVLFFYPKADTPRRRRNSAKSTTFRIPSLLM